ncbi:hydantoinase/oxoprolinase family protein [Caballeronia sp. LZ001]|uniref:hydantoinase/oxoprolinase family protein n=1 Tax=Caballeronia sp. LZ001 TaxID=3038553 RepID=UPI00285CB34F|nr:hydantoinase/oxoprolinase family protein [Caballeronia sp. LZ001]MDR5800216.1 hydantoinase/oxoprolinase family protein [Caballeronia sp. LZ001]
MMTSRFAISVDIGGTFTDFVLLDSKKKSVTTAKVLSTPERSEEAIFSGFEHLRRDAELDLADCDVFLHATTVITNAVIERKGHDFILLHTEGFGTTLETGREHRYNVSNLRLAFPKPLTKHRLKVSVRERIAYTGDLVRQPDQAELIADVRRLVEETGVTNFAICFLHAFQNPANEQLVESWLAEAFPNAVISTSSAVAPRSGEYERWMTCAVNAFTKPLLSQYVKRLETRAADAGFNGRLLMMTSSGLPLPIGHCVRAPVRLIESGPAAGVLAAREIAARNAPAPQDSGAVDDTVLAYDMGGTTAKGAFLIAGKVDVQAGLEVAREGAFEAGSGFPLIIPALDLIEIGAGGGSIAEIDERGAISVGPKSAGAVPGPACYARGGQAATVTDANLFLGFLGEANFHNSGIDATRFEAKRAIQQNIAEPLGISVERAAIGIHRTINENVARAFRVHAAELGVDYRRATLVCTGGSSPVHALPIAQLLSIRRVIFPFAAGVASAMGQFASSEGIILQQTRKMSLADVTDDVIAQEVARLVQAEPYASQLVDGGARTIVKLGMRYEGQDSEVTVEISDEGRYLNAANIRARFLDAYKDIFGLKFPDYGIEISTWVVEVSLPEHLKSVRDFSYDALTPSARMEKEPRSCYISDGATEVWTEVPVFNRYALPVGWKRSGPALIEENDTTIYVPAFAEARIASTLDLIAELKS